jgi:hypothetical protein
MAFDFSNVQFGKRDHKKIILLYGVPGIGKTTQASMLDAAFFIPVEDGTADLDVGQYVFDDGRVKLKTLQEVYDVLAMVYENGAEAGIKNLVIDSVSALEPLIWEQVCAEGDDKGNAKANIEDFGYGGGYKRALKKWKDFFDMVIAIRDDLKVNVWLLGHSTVKSMSLPDMEPFDRYIPELHKDAVGLLQKNCDAVIFAKYREVIRKVDGKMGAKENKAIGQGERIMFTSEMPAYMAKSRSNPPLPQEMPFSCQLLLDSWNKVA